MREGGVLHARSCLQSLNLPGSTVVVELLAMNRPRWPSVSSPYIPCRIDTRNYPLIKVVGCCLGGSHVLHAGKVTISIILVIEEIAEHVSSVLQLIEIVVRVLLLCVKHSSRVRGNRRRVRHDSTAVI